MHEKIFIQQVYENDNIQDLFSLPKSQIYKFMRIISIYF
jgi:hypothetical protein